MVYLGSKKCHDTGDRSFYDAIMVDRTIMGNELIIKNGCLFSPESGEAGCLPDYFIPQGYKSRCLEDSLIDLSRQAAQLSFIRIESGTIKEVGPMDQLNLDMDCQVIDASECLMMPGLVNGHCHGAMTLFRGLADDLELMDWLENHIFPAEAKCVTPEMVYWCSKLAAAEMLRGGITTVADGYFYEDSAARAFADAGMRAVVAQGVVDFPAPGVPDPARKIQVVSDFVDLWKNHKRIVPAVFAHSPYTCGPDTLKEAKDLARSKDCLFFIHLGETKQEAEGIKSKTGLSPVGYLQSLHLLDESTVCIHCVWLDQEDINILAQNNAKVVTCPESNMKLASGISPVKELVDAGVIVGLGTDGAASNNDLNMFREMGSCFLLQNHAHLHRPALSELNVLEMATSGGAAVLGLENLVGSIEPGKKADIVLMDLGRFNMQDMSTVHNLIHSVSGSEVTTVIVDGEVILKNREIVSFDEHEAMEKVRHLARKVKG
jgi:5-methylthioadenosine/S-adenosylhomocysteine deaminase